VTTTTGALTTRWWTVLGFVGSVVAVLAGSFDRPGPGRWLVGAVAVGDPGNVVRDAGFGVASIVCLSGISLLGVSWVRVVSRWRSADVLTSGGTTGAALGTVALWALPFAVGPVLFSADVFSYAAQGQIVGAGLDPYRNAASDLPVNSPVIDLIAPIWTSSPSPYGPLWSRISGWAAQFGEGDPFLTVTVLRVVALTSVVVMAWAVTRLAQRSPTPAAVVLATVGNPLVLIHLVSGAHNEALMLALLLTAVVVARFNSTGNSTAPTKRWPRAMGALVVIGAAVAVKAPAVVGAVAMGWSLFARPDSTTGWQQRLRGLAVAGLISGASLAIITWVTGLGWGWVTTLTTPGPSRAITAPVRGLGFALAQLTGPLGHLTTNSEVTAITGPVGAILTLSAAGAVLWWRRESPIVELTGWLSLAVVLFGPSLYPWYIITPVVFVGLSLGAASPTSAGDDWRWRMIALTSIILSVAQLPSGASVIYLLGAVGPWASALLWVALVAYGATTRPDGHESSNHATI